jgi:hypothetical protein
MAFTNVSLNTQTLLETTFISDMRLILNANNAVLRGKLEDVINTFEFDLVNKYIGVDNYVNQVKTNNVILGNGIAFMDSTNTIGQLSKSAGKSILSIDKLIIQAGGSIDMTGAANSMAVTRLGVGIPLASIIADGFYVGSSTISVKSEFYGETNFPAQAITQSTEGTTNTVVTTTAVNVGGTDYYYGSIKLSKSSKQFMYLSIRCADSSPSSSKPVVIFVYEDIANRPNPGQTFNLIVKEYTNTAGTTPIVVGSWGDIKVVPGYLNPSYGTPVLLNGGAVPVVSTASNAITALTTTQHITMYNTNVQASITSARAFGATVNLTKFENTVSGLNTTGSRFVITSSHNIEITN